MMRPIHAFFIESPVEYNACAAGQQALVEARARNEIPDTALFLEHQPVITVGVRGKQEHIRLTHEELRKRGIAIEPTSRGGDVTYHAPGQLVMYPILKLEGAEQDAHRYVWRLEETAIRTVRRYGIEGYRRDGLTGVWTKEGKIAAIGVRFSRWVAFHGISLNVDIDLAGFETIIPCGLPGEPVASLAAILGDAPPALAEVRSEMARQLEDVFQRRLIVAAAPDLAYALRAARAPA